MSEHPLLSLADLNVTDIKSAKEFHEVIKNNRWMLLYGAMNSGSVNEFELQRMLEVNTFLDLYYDDLASKAITVVLNGPESGGSSETVKYTAKRFIRAKTERIVIR